MLRVHQPLQVDQKLPHIPLRPVSRQVREHGFLPRVSSAQQVRPGWGDVQYALPSILWCGSLAQKPAPYCLGDEAAGPGLIDPQLMSNGVHGCTITLAE